MRTPNSEQIDLMLTQAIENYLEMSDDEARAAIKLDWYEQTATLLIDYLFVYLETAAEFPIFDSRTRKSSDSNYIAKLTDNEEF